MLSTFIPDQESARKNPAQAAVRAQNPVGLVEWLVVIERVGDHDLHPVFRVDAFDQDRWIGIQAFDWNAPKPSQKPG